MIDKVSMKGLDLGSNTSLPDIFQNINSFSSMEDHHAFSSKMGQLIDSNITTVEITNNPSNNIESSSLSSHLFGAQIKAKNEFDANIIESANHLEGKEHVSAYDILELKKNIADTTTKAQVLVKACEKSIETFNMLLKMQ